MDQRVPNQNIPFHFLSCGRPTEKKELENAQKINKEKTLTTSLLVIFAQTIPNAKVYKAGWFSNICTDDFCEIINAGMTIRENGMMGEITLVP